MPKKHSKRFRKAAEGVDKTKLYSIEEAVKELKARVTTKFDESIDLAVKLGIDTKQADQLVRGSLSLPHGIGKTMRVVAFCEGAEADAARAAGASEVGSAELAAKIEGGWMEFDVAVAHPNMMRYVGKLGKVLGPKGLMPSPKSGTVTDKVADAVREFVAGKIEFRNDKDGNIHMMVGKASFEAQKMAENIQAAIAHIISLKPASVRKIFVQKITIASSMGPGFRINVQEIEG